MQHLFLLNNVPTFSGLNVWPSSGSFLNISSVCLNSYTLEILRTIKIFLWWSNVRILRINFAVRVQLKYIWDADKVQWKESIKSFCCWYNLARHLHLDQNNLLLYVNCILIVTLILRIATFIHHKNNFYRVWNF